MTRRLTAILATDVVGYSALMAADENGTLDALRRLRSERLGPEVTSQGGEIVKSMGDGFLIAFPSAAAATHAAMRLQESLAGHALLKLRMGIHIGDVTREGDDLFGDAVNVAARLEGIAEPGEIMVSDSTFYSLDGTLSPSFDDGGLRDLKNLSRPIRVFVRAAPPPPELAGDATEGFPRLAILPVATVDPRTELRELADIFTADAATYLGAVTWLRTSISETPADGAYALRCALRARGDSLRLDVRLLSPEGEEIWLDKIDGHLSESFDWQDEVVEKSTNGAYMGIAGAETARLNALDQTTLGPGQCLLMGVMAWEEISLEASRKALGFFSRAIGMRPDMGEALAEAIQVTISMQTVGYSTQLADYVARLPEWLDAARRIKRRIPTLDISISIAEYMGDGDTARLNRSLEAIMRRAPFDFRTLGFAGWGHVWSGNPRRALECFEKAMRLGRLNPLSTAMLSGAANACVQLGRDEQALVWAAKSLELSKTYPAPYLSSSAALAHLGRLDEARKMMAEHMRLVPGTTLTRRRAVNDYGGGEGGARYFEGLRLAGMPE